MGTSVTGRRVGVVGIPLKISGCRGDAGASIVRVSLITRISVYRSVWVDYQKRSVLI
jgi:hypothetical protein